MARRYGGVSASSNALQRRLEQLQLQEQAILSELARIEALPKDVFEDGSIITFESPGWLDENGGVCYSSESGPYTFAAIKLKGWWFTTGKNQRPVGWETIMRLVGDGDIWYVTGLKALADG